MESKSTLTDGSPFAACGGSALSLGEAVERKFNATSEKYGLSVKIKGPNDPSSPTGSGAPAPSPRTP